MRESSEAGQEVQLKMRASELQEMGLCEGDATGVSSAADQHVEASEKGTQAFESSPDVFLRR